MSDTEPAGEVVEVDAMAAWARVRELEDHIRDVVLQQGDDLCWMDVYTKLAGLVGVQFDPTLLPDEQMLTNCKRFITSLRTGGRYHTHWRRLSDHLPPQDGDYLVGFWGTDYTGPEIQIATYDTEFGIWWLTLSDYHPGTVTYWAPLPQPPPAEDVINVVA
jgi:hypothetical protein